MNRRFALVPGMFLAALGSLGTPAVMAAPPGSGYTITEMPTLGGKTSYALDVGATGRATGIADAADGSTHAVLWDRGALTDLGTLGGKTSTAFSLNNAGQVAGIADRADGSVHAFLWSSGQMTDLGTLGGASSVGARLNGSSWVTGYSTTAAGQKLGDPGTHGFLWHDGTMADLGTLGGSVSRPNGINDAGDVTGVADTAAGAIHAFVSDRGALADIGTLPGMAAGAGIRINRTGQVAGWSWAAAAGANVFAPVPLDTAARAFLYDRGTMTDLGTLPGLANSRAFGLNDTRQVTGFAANGPNDLHAWLWDHGTMKDLTALLPSDSGWVLMNANGINDAGQIVGQGRHNGDLRGYLLTPTGRSVLPNTGAGHAPVGPAVLLILGAATVLLGTGSALRSSNRTR